MEQTPVVNAVVYETAEQIAARLHVAVSTVYTWARRPTNQLPARRVTHKVLLFVWSEVQRWVEQGGTLRPNKKAALRVGYEN
jgi:hypothetical protein